jgi:hypothetical protein
MDLDNKNDVSLQLHETSVRSCDNSEHCTACNNHPTFRSRSSRRCCILQPLLDDKKTKLSDQPVSSPVTLMAKNKICVLRTHYNVFLADGVSESLLEDIFALLYIFLQLYVLFFYKYYKKHESATHTSQFWGTAYPELVEDKHCG